MAHTSFQQFLNVLRNDAARRRVGLNITDAEAEQIAGDPNLARAYYDWWVNAPRPDSSVPAGWYPAPHARNQMRYWDGGKWLASSSPTPNVGASPSSRSVTAPFTEQHPAFVVTIIAAFLSLLAILPWPYEYYIFLRWTLSITAVFVGVHAVRNKQQGWLFAAIPIFLLWAPAAFFPLDRGVWSVLNVLAAGVLVASGWFLGGPPTPRPDGKPRWEWWKIAVLSFGIGLVLALLGQPAINAVDCDLSYERAGTSCY